MTDMTTLFTLAAIWLASQYLVGPVVTWLTLRAPDRYQLPAIASEDAIGALAGEARALHEAIGQLGFVACAATEVPNVRAILYVHPFDGAGLQLRITKSFNAVCFAQYYANGTVLFFGNSPLPSIYPPWHKRTGFSCPGGKDVARLFEMFKAIRARQSLGPRLPAIPQKELKMTEAYLNEELAYLVATGFYSRGNGRSRRVSLRGAIRMTWILAWPSRPIVNFLAARRTRRALSA